MFSSVIQELSVKLNKSNNEQNNNNNNHVDEIESNYNNQSVYSLSSNDSKKDDSSVTYSKNDITFLDDEPLYQFYDASLFDVSIYVLINIFIYVTMKTCYL